MSSSGSQQGTRDKYDDAGDALVSVAEWTDVGNAARLAKAQAGKLLRVSDMKKWHHWDGTRWAIDYDNREVREAAKIEAIKLPEGSRTADKFKTRYATLGFNDPARLDDGAFWPVAYALQTLTPAAEAQIAALLQKAVN